MTEPTQNDSSKVTLEALLRLKRHERPGREYWERFDREFNEKVWRALANPTEPRTGLLPVWLLRGMRWMTVGAVSAFALMLAWPTAGTMVQSPKRAVASPNAAVSPMAAVTPATATVAVPTKITSLMSAPVVDAPTAQTTFAVANLNPSTSPAGLNKIPATLSLPAERISGERYATDELNEVASSARWHGSAY